MERYGIAKITASEETGDVCGRNCALRVQNNFFKNLKDCIQSAIALGEFDKPIYFKILKNKEIVSLIHEPGANANFGYVYVTTRPGEQLNLLSHTNKLYDNLLECITDKHIEKCHTQELCNTSMCVKIAYFKILKDCEIISELHRPCN